jgi:hypothetical protein
VSGLNAAARNTGRADLFEVARSVKLAEESYRLANPRQELEALVTRCCHFGFQRPDEEQRSLDALRPVCAMRGADITDLYFLAAIDADRRIDSSAPAAVLSMNSNEFAVHGTSTKLPRDEALASAASVRVEALAALEEGQGLLSTAKLGRIAGALGLDPIAILEGQAVARPDPTIYFRHARIADFYDEDVERLRPALASGLALLDARALLGGPPSLRARFAPEPVGASPPRERLRCGPPRPRGDRRSERPDPGLAGVAGRALRRGRLHGRAAHPGCPRRRGAARREVTRGGRTPGAGALRPVERLHRGG